MDVSILKDSEVMLFLEDWNMTPSGDNFCPFLVQIGKLYRYKGCPLLSCRMSGYVQTMSTGSEGHRLAVCITDSLMARFVK
jgi:hypothetical protein